LRHVYEKWIEAKSPSKDSIAACGRSLKLFEEQSGNPTLEQLSRLHGEKFRKWLIEQPTTSKTARDRMNWVKLLLNFAPHTVDFHFANPWVGMEIKWRTTLARQPWTAEHLSTLFNHKIWQHGVLPTDNKAGGVAAYWIPLLGLYTGARCSELCQLRVDDINWSDKVPTIRITDEGDDQSVKTMAGHRVIPIHSELIRLGLLDYVKSLNSKSLWPALPRRTDKAGGFFSQYFGTLRKSLDIPPDTVFHSFRHGVRSLLAEQGILEPTIDRILGHESGGSVGTRVYTHVTLETLQKAIETLTYKIPTISCLSKLGLV
jgi:integrase